MKVLVAGPWCGSLHGELLCWQGWLRKISKLYEKTYVVTSEDKSEIYSDFATVVSRRDQVAEKHELVTVSDVPIDYSGRQVQVHDQVFVPLGDIGKISVRDRRGIDYEAVIEAPTKSMCYTRYEWARITCGLNHTRDIAWAQTGAEKAQHVFGSDVRDYDFRQLLEVVRKSKIAIALTPGLAALASLTGTPFISVTDGPQNLWKSAWNPFKTPGLTFLSRPSVDQIIKGSKKLLDKWDESLYELPSYQDTSSG